MERGPAALLTGEIAALECELADERQRSASLESLVASLMSEMTSLEERRSRERRISRGTGGLVPREAVENAREILEEGSNALMAAHEHTLRLVEMRMAAMGAQLARCASALPQPPTAGPPTDEGRSSPASPTTTSYISRGHYSFVEEEWAEPNSGGLCLDSLPLHVPGAGSHGGAVGVTGGAFGIHGRRPAISTSPWSSSPAALKCGWWEQDATGAGRLTLGATLDDDDPAPARPSRSRRHPPAPAPALAAARRRVVAARPALASER